MHLSLFIMDIKRELKNILKGKITIVGVGNIMRGDDGFGPQIAEGLKGRLSADIINAGPAPENHIKAIRDSKPETVLIIDTADLGGDAGEVNLLKRDDIPLYGLSTHNASLALLFDFLKQDMKANVYMLAIQPARSDINTPISDIVAERLNEIESIFLDLLKW